MPQHCATIQNSALDAALGNRCATEDVSNTSSLHCWNANPMPPPGEGTATASPTTHRLGTQAPRPLEDPQRKPPSIDRLLVSRETSDHEYSV